MNFNTFFVVLLIASMALGHERASRIEAAQRNAHAQAITNADRTIQH